MAISALNHIAHARDALHEAGRWVSKGGRRGHPLGVLEAIQNAGAALDLAERELVRGARQEDLTWDQIGRVYGVTRQAARQKFGADEHDDSLCEAVLELRGDRES